MLHHVVQKNRAPKDLANIRKRDQRNYFVTSVLLSAQLRLTRVYQPRYSILVRLLFKKTIRPKMR